MDLICIDTEHNLYQGRGLIDLQVNGINGIDFNDVTLTEEQVLSASEYLLSRGVTSYFPTIITNPDAKVTSLLDTLVRAIERYPVVRKTILGIHLEGPFLSPVDGARGAHDIRYIQNPDWSLVERFQDVANGLIRLITMAPERAGSVEFIRWCRRHHIMVSIGHSMAKKEDIEKAVDAGLTFSTHLGNAVPLVLPRHPNMIWDQLANDNLCAMIIADGHHIPDSFIKVVMKVKGDRVLLVSDATKFAGMSPGEYESTIGDRVVLDDENRLSMVGADGLLAGAAKDLLQNVETLIGHGLCSINQAWKMASENIFNVLTKEFPELKNQLTDAVTFQIKGHTIIIKEVAEVD